MKIVMIFNMTSVLEVFMEVHQKDHSLMNERWGWNNVMMLKGDGKWQLKSYSVRKD